MILSQRLANAIFCPRQYMHLFLEKSWTLQQEKLFVNIHSSWSGLFILFLFTQVLCAQLIFAQKQ